MGFDPVSYIIGRRAGRAAADPLKSWSELQLWLRAGQLGQVLEAGDQLNVAVGGVALDFDVLGLDEDVAVNPDLQHVLSIQAHDILGQMSFDPPMYLFAVTEAACQHFGWPSSGANAGMPAGTYNLTLDHGAFNHGTDQDGTYQFTTTRIVPIGGGIRHTQIGMQAADASYSKAQILAGTFMSYAADTVTTIETDLATTEGSGGSSLGTTSSREPRYRSGNYINYTIRQAYGCNRLSWSYFWQWLNSDDSVFAWQPKSAWSRDTGERREGFLHSIDPALRQVLGKVRKRVALSVSDNYGYEDLEGFCFPSFMVDLGQGANSGVYEGPVDAEGTVKREAAYSYWSGAQDADCVKYSGSEARPWWIGSTFFSNPSIVRVIGPVGTLSSANAKNLYGAVPSLFII